METINYGLGRLEPLDFDHIQRHSLRTLGISTVANVEKSLVLPSWHQKHDQGAEGACVGFGTSMMLAILNGHQCRLQGAKDPYVRYNPWWLWDRAKEIDGFPESNPGDQSGTTVRAACEILRTLGAAVWDNEDDTSSFVAPEQASGIAAYRWANTVDEVRATIENNTPLVIGVNWYLDFDVPVYSDGEWYIGKQSNLLGGVRGGHSLCVYGASDKRQAFRLKNSWGLRYPEVWMPYTTFERLISENGEVALVTDI